MAIQLKKSYKFALRSSSIVSCLLTALLAGIYFFMDQKDYKILMIFFPSAFLISFFIIQTRIEWFIYRRVKKIYDEGLPHKISVQNFNKYIKEIGKIAGINEMIDPENVKSRR